MGLWLVHFSFFLCCEDFLFDLRNIITFMKDKSICRKNIYCALLRSVCSEPFLSSLQVEVVYLGFKAVSIASLKVVGIYIVVLL